MTARQTFVSEGVLIIAQERESALIRERIVLQYALAAMTAERDALKAQADALADLLTSVKSMCAEVHANTENRQGEAFVAYVRKNMAAAMDAKVPTSTPDVWNGGGR